ncbi:unnamed protein product [Lota lota]
MMVTSRDGGEGGLDHTGGELVGVEQVEVQTLFLDVSCRGQDPGVGGVGQLPCPINTQPHAPAPQSEKMTTGAHI